MGDGRPAMGHLSPPRSFLPIRDEEIEPSLGDDATGGPDELLAVGAEHRKTIELRIVGYLFESAPIEVHEIQLEVPAPRVFVIRREDDLPVVRREERPE